MRAEFHPQQAFAGDGIFAARWPEFEYRPVQQKMSALVWQICENGGYALIEAGTGTGKSLAYLYPVFLALQEKMITKGPVIISTHTINLQQQLMEKEIPFLNATLGTSLQAALLLGRGNYLCWRKLRYYQQNSGLLENGASSIFERIYRAAENELGCIEQLGFYIPLDLKEKITSEAATCLRKHCPYQNRCFWVAARKQAFSSSVIIVNHHLFFTDLAMRRQRDFSEESLVLPPYQFVIFDEAHHLAEVAAEHLGIRIDQNEINHICKRLLHKEGKWGRGWLTALRQRLVGQGTDLAQMQKLVGTLENVLIPELINLETLFRNFFQSLPDTVRLSVGTSRDEETKYRYKTNLLTNPGISADVNRLEQALATWTKALSLFVDELQNEDKWQEDAIFLAEAGRFFSSLEASLPLLLDGSDEQFVSWLTFRAERGDRTIRSTLNRVPLQLGDLLYRDLFAQVQGAVLTSATLAVANDFSYIKERLGLQRLPADSCQERIFASPFNYESNVLVLIVRDLPPPEASTYLDAVSALLPGLVQAADGRSLLLFTNKQQMNQVFMKIGTTLKATGINLLRQGEEPRHRLLQKFQSNPKTALLGMDSFWEGIDLPGQQLSNVIMLRLPFRVPSEPLFAAKWEALVAEGKDPFFNLSLPEAVIKFKQGFGRLIRTQTDHGVVVILDQRIYGKRYGKIFLRSIPGGKVVAVDSSAAPELIAHWLSEHS